MKDPYKRECLKCGHIWLKRITKEPRKCPNCQSYKWNKPKQDKKDNE